MASTTPRTSAQVAAVSLAFALVAGLGTAALVAPSSAAPVGAADAVERTALGENLIKNSGFAKGFSGWSRSTAKGAALEISAGGVWGSRWAAQMRAEESRAASLRDARATAPRSVEGQRYQASVWVRATGKPVTGLFELNQWKRNEVSAHRSEGFTARSDRWTQVTFVTRAVEHNSALQLCLVAKRTGDGRGLKVDRVRLQRVQDVPASPDPSPTTSPSESPEPTPTGSPTTSTGDTLFGASVYQGSRAWTQAVADSNAAYGGMEVVRVFYPGLPTPWPGRAGQVGGPVVVSFKANPADVMAGKHDAYLANWFATAPRDRNIWWTYWHEPEDDVEDGSFTAQQWRDAYRHIAAFANAADNPRLFNTVVLMCWTVNPRSGRSFQNYFPGSDVVEALAWDCYSVPSSSGGYAKPEDIYGRALATTRGLGLQFGVAETGSLLVAGDADGSQRAAWLASVGDWLQDQDATFVCYFDSLVGGEYRLLDSASRQAWHGVVTGVGSHQPF